MAQDIYEGYKARIAALEAEIERLRAVFDDGLEYFLFQQNFHPDDREIVALDYWTSGHWPEDTRKAKWLAAALRERAALEPK